MKYVQEIWRETGQMELMMTASEVRSVVCGVVGTDSQTYFSELFIFFLRNYKKLEFL